MFLQGSVDWLFDDRGRHEAGLGRGTSIPRCDVLPYRFNHLLQVRYLSISLVSGLLSHDNLIHCVFYFVDGTDNGLEVFVHQVYAVEAATDEFSHGDKLLDLESRDRILEAV